MQLEEALNTKLIHICEVCGRRELLTPQEGYEAGWDYPPIMGSFRTISPRTCPNCRAIDTAWAALTIHSKKIDALSERQARAVLRILFEPESILPEDSQSAAIAKV